MTAQFFKHDQAVIHPQAKVGEGTRVWAFCNIQEGAEVGAGCNICDGCFIEQGARVGNNVTLKNGVNIWEGVELADDVFCGSQATFINDRHPRSNRQDEWTLEKTTVGKGATVGSNATILCGVTVGNYALIGAGSVVTKDVPPHTLVTGNPAVSKGFICRCGKKIAKDFSCECGLRYHIEKGMLSVQE